MEPERNSPYWNDIVGENWPAIPPTDWSGLETAARDGAARLDPLEADRVRRIFDERVRSSRSLQRVKDEMLAQQGGLERFVDALVAAADTFGQMSGIAYRTRHRILDIVDRATAKINKVNSTAKGDGVTDQQDAEQKQERIDNIVGTSASEVEDVAQNALNSISPQGLPELALLAELLGQPSPWATAGGSRPGGYSTHPQPAGFPAHPKGPGSPLPPGIDPRSPLGQFLARLPLFRDFISLDPNGRYPSSPLQQLGDVLDRWLHGHSSLGVAVEHLPATEVPAGTNGPSGPHLGGSATVYAPPGAAPGPGAGGPIDSSHTSAVAPSPSGPESHVAEPVSAPSEHSASSAHSAGPASGGGDHVSPTGVDQPSPIGGHHADTGVPADAPDPVGRAQRDAEVAATLVPPPGAVVGPAFSQSSAMASTPLASAGPTASAAPGPMAASSPAGQPASVIDARGADSGVSAAGQRGSVASGPAVSGAAVSPVKPPPVVRTGSPADHAHSGSGELVRDAVGAAMVAAAAPSFMKGEQVSGELVLARSLLSSLLVVADEELGPAWAVSVMRHAGGVSAFVTSNEGRGWLPPKVFVPHEMSTPWVWSVSEGSAWEGIADPARVLVEFGMAWGRQSGAQLAALVSSQPIDPHLRRQLGDLPVLGSVQPDPVMDFATPAPALTDRLGMVGSPRLLHRVTEVPDDQIAGRCIDLAVDAHRRATKPGPGALGSLGSATVRERILPALQRGREVPEPLWDELRDADALLSASMVPLRSDVSRVPLGELRLETIGRSASDVSALRAMLFERRCDELVLLLAGDPTRQVLRDAVYAHGQLVDHPDFDHMSSAAPDAGVDRVRPTITAGPGR